jgi:hypothetical protein
MFTFQIYAAKTNGIHFELGALTVDPQSAAYDPRPLIPYLAELGLTYLYESQNIMEQVKVRNFSRLPKLASGANVIKLSVRDLRIFVLS